MPTVMNGMKSAMKGLGAGLLGLLRLRLVRKTLVCGLVAGVLAGGYLLADRFGYVEQAGTKIDGLMADASADAGFTVATVAVRDNQRVATLDVIRASGIRKGAPIQSIDPRQVQERIEKLGWVDSASVRRSLPDTVEISVVEREPFAVWQVDGVHHLIDQAGHVILSDLSDGYAELVLVVGKGANRQAADLLQHLNTIPQLGSRVVAAVRVSDRRWNVQLDNDVDIRLPEEDVETAWKLLAQMQEDHRVLNKDVLSVDLRVPGQIILRTTLEQAERRLGRGKNT